MRSCTVLGATITLLLTVVSPGKAQDQTGVVGKPAPSLKVLVAGPVDPKAESAAPGPTAREFALKPFRGKVVLVSFVSTHC